MAGLVAIAKITEEVRERLAAVRNGAMVEEEDVVSVLVQFPVWVEQRFAQQPLTSVVSATTITQAVTVAQLFHAAMEAVVQQSPMSLAVWGLWLKVSELGIGLPAAVVRHQRLEVLLGRCTAEIVKRRESTTLYAVSTEWVIESLAALDAQASNGDELDAAIWTKRLSAVRRVSNFLPGVAQMSFATERRYLELRVLGNVDDEAYEALVRKTYQELLSVPHLAMDETLSEYRAFEIDEDMLKKHGPRMDRKVQALKQERWVQRYLSWVQQETGAAHISTATDDATAMDAHTAAGDRLETCTEAMYRAGHAAAAFVAEAAFLCSPRTCRFGISFERAARIAKILSSVAKDQPSDQQHTSAASPVVVSPSIRWAFHRHAVQLVVRRAMQRHRITQNRSAVEGSPAIDDRTLREAVDGCLFLRLSGCIAMDDPAPSLLDVGEGTKGLPADQRSRLEEWRTAVVVPLLSHISSLGASASGQQHFNLVLLKAELLLEASALSDEGGAVAQLDACVKLLLGPTLVDLDGSQHAATVGMNVQRSCLLLRACQQWSIVAGRFPDALMKQLREATTSAAEVRHIVALCGVHGAQPRWLLQSIRQDHRRTTATPPAATVTTSADGKKRQREEE